MIAARDNKARTPAEAGVRAVVRSYRALRVDRYLGGLGRHGSGFESGLRMSMPPLKNAPSSMLMRAAATSPVSAPSARMSTRSVAFDIALDLAEDHDFAGADAGRDLAVLAHGDAVAGQVDAALDLAVDIQRFGAGNLALDEEAFADGGLFADEVAAGARCLNAGLQRQRTGSERAPGVGVGEGIGPVGWVST